jgi:hypothetical protein
LKGDLYSATLPASLNYLNHLNLKCHDPSVRAIPPIVGIGKPSRLSIFVYSYCWQDIDKRGYCARTRHRGAVPENR